jgi:hypothetical protein
MSNWERDPGVRRFTRTNDGLVAYVADGRIWAKNDDAIADPARALATVDHVCRLKGIPAPGTDAILIVTMAPASNCAKGTITRLLMANRGDALLQPGEDILPNRILYDDAPSRGRRFGNRGA